MVDPVSGTGSVQNISSGNRSQTANNERAEERSEAKSDEVRISEEARELQARQEAQEARQKLEEDQEATLGLDSSFDEEA